MELFITGIVTGMIIGLPRDTYSEMLAQNSTKKGISQSAVIGTGMALSAAFMAIIDMIILFFLGKYIIRAKSTLAYVMGALLIIINAIGIIKSENSYDVDNTGTSFMNFMTGIMIGISEFTNIFLILLLYIYSGITRLKFREYGILLGGTAAGTFFICVAMGIIFKIADKIKKIESTKGYNLFVNIMLVCAGILIILKEAF